MSLDNLLEDALQAFDSQAECENIVPDLESELLFRRCFDLVATGLHTQADLLRTIAEAGLRKSERSPVHGAGVPADFVESCFRRMALPSVDVRSASKGIASAYGVARTLRPRAGCSRRQETCDGPEEKRESSVPLAWPRALRLVRWLRSQHYSAAQRLVRGTSTTTAAHADAGQ